MENWEFTFIIRISTKSNNKVYVDKSLLVHWGLRITCYEIEETSFWHLRDFKTNDVVGCMVTVRYLVNVHDCLLLSQSLLPQWFLCTLCLLRCRAKRRAGGRKCGDTTLNIRPVTGTQHTHTYTNTTLLVPLSLPTCYSTNLPYSSSPTLYLEKIFIYRSFKAQQFPICIQK